MPRETHVLRFKVLTVECAALPNGQQYTVMYHRGNTNRSTPCYTAQGGVINFASMPEGAAVVHFKAGHGGGRFAPKYIRFMIEEYTRGMPRRLVGETEADCTQVLKDYGASGSGILTVVFRLYGTTAKMRIAVLVYPEHAPPLSFDGLIDPSEVAAPLPPQALKVMNRGEAMMILMGLETLLERRRTMKAEGQSLPQSREEKKLAELEKRRKALVGSEGLATEVIKTRCEEVVAVQYTALARKHRNNFIGQTAAYLREMAMRAGEDFIDDDGNSSGNTVMEQLNRVNRSIEEVEMQVKKLEEEQTALGRIQHKVDVMAELSANLDKVAALQQKMQVLKESRTALTEAMKKQAARKNTPLAREVAAINARIAALNAEQQQMAPRIQHMVTVAASHVVKWARSKNPPELDIKSRIDTSRETGGNGRNAVDDLFSDDDKPKRSKEQPVMDDVQRKQVVEALKGLKTPTAPVPTRSPTSPTSASSSSGHRTPRDLFADAGLPTMGDFSNTKKKEEEAATKRKDDTSIKPVHEDPLKPSGLGVDMFSAKPAPAAASNVPAGLPSMNDFMRSSASSRQQDAQPTFDFGSILQASSVSPQMGGGFVLEPQQSEAAASSFAAAAPSAVRDAYNKRDDPYYDEMDDFTVPPDAADNKNYGAVEITGGIFGFQDDTNSPAYVASRPTFDFGPSGGGDDGPSGVGVTAPPAETFSFGGGTADEPSTNNRRNSSDDPYTGITNLPTYNFSS
ncbi:hypothetical protein, conserved [Leishmania donovani]|uniref:C2 NT-type domain-containing protein n=1 Tax=Leishmania donovani TaxID=5661 RepID=E9BA59_LEIDO|nr:hypothetical protein, conserved [Leishmania donovani]CBZ32132.1 hypothetical protein, conserved [Leishmania donovani]